MYRYVVLILLIYFGATLCLRMELRGETIATFAGTGVKGYSGDGGPATQAQLNNVFAIARGPDGSLYLCDTDNHCIRCVRTNGLIETVAGNGELGYRGDGGPASSASLNQPYEIAWDRSGNLYFVELGNHAVRRVDVATGIISTVAGKGDAGFSGDGGLAVDAQLNQPHSIAIDSAGDLFICDIGNHRIRRVSTKSGIIETWAGNGNKSTSPDGSSILGSSLFGPRALTFAEGRGWLALREGNSVLELDLKTTTIRRVAGTGKSGFTGNGGPALQATLSGPKAIALDKHGNVLIADTESHSIRRIDITIGTMDVIVGDGFKGDGPDGDDPLRCQLARPHGVFVDNDGSIFIGDSENHRIRVLRP